MNKHFSRSVWQSVAIALLALPVCAQQAAPARDTSPQILDVQGGKIRVVTVANGLFHPWGIAFADANTVLVTEKNGAHSSTAFPSWGPDRGSPISGIVGLNYHCLSVLHLVRWLS